MKRILAIWVILLTACLAQAQTTTFTYQGKLNDGAAAASGNYEFQFKIYDTVTVGTGNHIGGLVQTVNANVVNGIFTVQLDFGSATFSGDTRFIEVSVRRNSGESFVTLAPRQPLTSAPYSIRSKNAETAITAQDAAKLGGIPANDYVQTTANDADKVQIFGLGAAGSTQLCRNAGNEISTCSSSRRYKTNINDFRTGLEVINRLRPVTFNWAADNKPDLGLVAEEVAEADENLVIRNEKGEVEGVKYDRVGVVLVNAVKEQQTQIETQKTQIEDQAKQLEEQKKQIELLKQLVCSQNAGAAVCKEAK